MMKITEQKVTELAHLSRLRFEGESLVTIQQDLQDILQMCEKLQELETTGIEPLIYLTNSETVLRDDIVAQEITHEEALKNAPKRDSDFFRVPKVIDANV
ncbi:MAG: Asp-tRNA(Asn)/Glu-tRNA(Gln) amidotransferase subunit GatC [Flavobacteriaceae bacterium]|nr:Asp-tRNA(Asn)/Glu-tRNA(Gln) amidotransferase subunit GatC [Flavobacteriaceae bacterium]